MKRILSSLTLSLCLASVLAAGSFSANAADKAPEKKAEKAEKKAEKAVTKSRPVMGKIEAVDKTMKTLTLSGEKKQVLQVTSETKIIKAGKPATFDDATVGEEIGGSVVEEGGKLVLKSLRVGAKPGEGDKEPKGPSKAKKKAKEASEKAAGASGQ